MSTGGLANSQRTRPPRRNNRVASNNHAASASASPLPSTGGNGEVRSVLDGLDQNELTMLLSISQPSEMLEKVLGAVLMMVSPYSPHEVRSAPYLKCSDTIYTAHLHTIRPQQQPIKPTPITLCSLLLSMKVDCSWGALQDWLQVISSCLVQCTH